MSAEARGRTPGSLGSGTRRKPKRKQAVHAVRAQDQVGLERQDVATHALEIVFQRIGLGSGVDDLDSAPALGMPVEKVLQQFRPWALAVAQSGPEGLQLAESENAEPVALVARKSGPRKPRLLIRIVVSNMRPEEPGTRTNGSFFCGSGASILDLMPSSLIHSLR